MIIVIAILIVVGIFMLYQHSIRVNQLLKNSHNKILSSLDSIKTFFTITLIDKFFSDNELNNGDDIENEIDL